MVGENREYGGSVIVDGRDSKELVPCARRRRERRRQLLEIPEIPAYLFQGRIVWKLENVKI